MKNFQKYKAELNNYCQFRHNCIHHNHNNDYGEIEQKYQSFYSNAINYDSFLDCCKLDVFVENESFSKYMDFVLEKE